MTGQQINIFELSKPQYKITKPIRIVENFAGIGSQAKALKNLGVNFEHYRVIERDKYAIASYNAIHGTNFTTSDITKISGSDLGIVDTHLYDYIFTYSFPCQDLSLAGKQKGMAKGSNTRSSLLWEVERLLDECKELPQILLMENVPQVISQANISDFQKWQRKLELLGYSNYVQILNAKDYGIPQNRNRCFMVSILGDFYYGFPRKQKLKLRLKDMLEDEVDEKYYINNEKAQELINGLSENKYINPKIVVEPKVNQIGNITDEKNFSNPQTGRIYSVDGISPTLNTCGGGQREPKIVEPVIVASRGRNPHNPSDRTPGNDVEQRLEPNSEGICNTLTSVQKDNLVLEPAILTPKRTEYGKSIRKDYESGKVQESRHNMTELQPREDGISNTLTTVQKDNLVLEPKVVQAVGDRGNHSYSVKEISNTIPANAMSDRGQMVLEPNELQFIGGLGNKDRVGDGKELSRNFPQGERVYSSQGIGCSQTAQGGGTGSYTGLYLHDYRIRKLTPKECWRLMGFSDEDFEKASKVNSNAQLYKQAGNSIVVNVLEAIFKELL